MRIIARMALGLLLAAGLAGCGGDDGGDGVATAGGTPSATASGTAGNEGDAQALALKFAQCMRENGIPNFPDPTFQDGGGIGIDMPEGTAKATADAAMAACKQYMPNGGEPIKLDPERLAQLRKVARCMRESGYPDFPDPTDEGLQIDGNKHPDWNRDNAKFNAAMEACDKRAGL